jgi:large subunit ribosomal protein L23|tara:strand:+ start:3067 stop:3372 length:306 start_codon:yes stop_codon:yes gene_type:complete
MSKISTERLYEVIRSPLISEKSTFVSQFNYYVFKVAVNSTKHEIKEAIQTLFKVEVKSVNTLNQKGKVKKFRGKLGVRPGIKKAFVKLAEGQTIDTTLEVK